MCGRSVDAGVIGSAKLNCQFPKVFPGIFLRAGGDLGVEQIQDESIFVGGPDGSVAAKEACAGALFSSEAVGAIDESRNEPLETYGHLAQFAAKLFHYFVDHAAAYEGFSHGDIRAPLRTMREQVLDGNCQVMIRIHEPCGRSDDSMPVRVGIVGKCYLVLVFEAHQSGHRIRTGAIHTNLAVMVDSHE